MNIHDKAMLVKLSISQWTAKRVDRKITHEVEEKYNAENSGKFSKVLIAHEALKEIEGLVSAVRSFHYRNTLPWLDDGSRILPSANYFDYTRYLRDYKQKFNEAVDRFVGAYDTYVEESKRRLNDMFNAEDYPASSELKYRYQFDVAVYPMPAGQDFRVELTQEEVEQIQKDIEGRVQESYGLAVADLWARLKGVLLTVVDRLQDEDAVFRDSLITNVKETAELVSRLNLGNDPDIATMCSDLIAVGNFPPQEIRESPIVRHNVVIKANELLKRMP